MQIYEETQKNKQFSKVINCREYGLCSYRESFKTSDEENSQKQHSASIEDCELALSGSERNTQHALDSRLVI